MNLTTSTYFPDETQLLVEERLDLHVRQLETEGFQVVRIPLFVPSYGWRGSGVPYLSYNNALIENYTERSNGKARSVAYVPRFGLKELDEAAFRIYRAVGFEVVPVDGFVATAAREGVVNCGVKVLERSE